MCAGRVVVVGSQVRFQNMGRHCVWATCLFLQKECGRRHMTEQDLSPLAVVVPMDSNTERMRSRRSMAR